MSEAADALLDALVERAAERAAEKTCARLAPLLGALSVPEDPHTPWCTVEQAAKRVGVSDERLRKAMNRGEIPCYPVPGTTRAKRLRKEEVDAWLGYYGAPDVPKLYEKRRRRG